MTSPSKKPTIVVFGGINMDLVGITDRMPVLGETIVGERFFTAPGGKGANQAVAAARMGANIEMIGRVGKDTFGPVLLEGLQSHGIDVQGVAEDSANSSGIALILVDSNAQNQIIVIPGANHACDESQLEAAKKAIDDADALMLQLEVRLEILIEAAQYAQSRGVKVIWDPAPARDLPKEVYETADILTPNQAEAESLTSIEVTDADSAAKAARILRDRGVHTAVVKLGEMGVYYESPDDQGFLPAYKVDVVDTVAAGDAFAGGLAVALAEGKPLRQALSYGSAAGALAVTKSGAQPSMPLREDVEALVMGRAISVSS